ncbi:hypothetical protein [Paraflavitalea sp. CAU 1676]|uniref:hypothetical protein n=1 Tax=Paraflavitalea sp. CAU 1676 TaxID=3032598 RepID=UPI0023DA60F0|nr:hypothetical protein [Paraflavitalea sp. CAU 1676]MDF2187699.1 hypothetical protein [Paraflavitalea sp. CAU 1676]
MAKNISPMFKLQGTIAGFTHVNSVAYGAHIRAERGTYTPIELNKTMKQCKDRLLKTNVQVKAVFDQLKDEYRDGTLWSRLLSIFYRQSKEGLKPSTAMLNNLDCNMKCKLRDVLSNLYQVNVVRKDKSMQVEIVLDRVPPKRDIEKITHYRLHVVVLYPNFSKGKVRKEMAAGEMTTFNSELSPLQLELSAPSLKAPFVLLLGISAYTKVEKYYPIWSYRALSVVRTG